MFRYLSLVSFVFSFSCRSFVRPTNTHNNNDNNRARSQLGKEHCGGVQQSGVRFDDDDQAKHSGQCAARGDYGFVAHPHNVSHFIGDDG